MCVCIYIYVCVCVCVCGWVGGCGCVVDRQGVEITSDC